MSSIYGSPQLIAPSRRPLKSATKSLPPILTTPANHFVTTSRNHIIDHNHSSINGVSHNKSNRYNNLILIIFFLSACILLIYTITTLPHLTTKQYELIKFPRSLDDVSTLSTIISKYTNNYYFNVLIVYCSIYIFLQTFAIPGAIFLSVLAGPLFGKYIGLLIVSIVATTGGTMCYTLSMLLGHELVPRYFPGLLQQAHIRINQHRDNIIYYLLFLRISPLLPNWFISLSSPHLGITYPQFIIATFIGLIPANYIHVTTGIQLDELGHSTGDGVKYTNILILMGIALLALLPTLFKNKLEIIDRQTIKKIN